METKLARGTALKLSFYILIHSDIAQGDRQTVKKKSPKIRAATSCISWILVHVTFDTVRKISDETNSQPEATIRTEYNILSSVLPKSIFSFSK